MTELRRCSRCRSDIELNYFAINRKGERNKTCVNCLDKAKTFNSTPERQKARQQCNEMLITCNNCGEEVTKNTLSLHKRRYWCKTHHLKERPEFEEWLMEQDYDKLLWEYKKILEEILHKNKSNEIATKEKDEDKQNEN